MSHQLRMQHRVVTLNDYISRLKGNIKYDAWYQRPEVWSKKKKQKLIDSILNKYDIGVIYLREIENEDYNYEVLDGQQRLRAIDQFIEGEFKTNPDLNPDLGAVSYDELEGMILPSEDIALHSKWLSFQLHIQDIISGNQHNVADFFRRLQEGMKLNTPEILNAILGEMRDTVINLSEHELFNDIGVPSKRYKHRYLTAQVFNMEINGDYTNSDVPNMRKKDLVPLYENHRGDVPSTKEKRVRETYNLMNRTFDDVSFIRKQGDFLPIYMLIRYIKDFYAIRGRETEISKFVKDFITKVENIDTDSTQIPTDKKPYYEYRVARSTGALSRESFRNRFETLVQKCLESLSDLERKSRQRTFNYGQRLAIYSRDGGECQQCEEEIDFGEAEFHHVVKYEDGGPTTVENGVMVHPSCHPRG